MDTECVGYAHKGRPIIRLGPTCVKGVLKVLHNTYITSVITSVIPLWLL